MNLFFLFEKFNILKAFIVKLIDYYGGCDLFSNIVIKFDVWQEKGR